MPDHGVGAGNSYQSVSGIAERDDVGRQIVQNQVRIVRLDDEDCMVDPLRLHIGNAQRTWRQACIDQRPALAEHVVLTIAYGGSNRPNIPGAIVLGADGVVHLGIDALNLAEK